jgi:predicted nucleotidyltransferase
MSVHPHLDPLPSRERNPEQSLTQHYKLCRVNVEDREKIYEQLRELARLLKSKHKVKRVYLYGSFARGDFHQGSDIDLIIVGEFEGRMHQRIGKILDLTSLPVEPLVYTEAEFEQMRERAFLKEVLATAQEL